MFYFCIRQNNKRLPELCSSDNFIIDRLHYPDLSVHFMFQTRRNKCNAFNWRAIINFSSFLIDTIYNSPICDENGFIKMIQRVHVTPQPICEFQVNCANACMAYHGLSYPNPL